jgi:hypothetical protein
MSKSRTKITSDNAQGPSLRGPLSFWRGCALQRGAPLDEIRKSLMRDPRGQATTPIGTALDLIARDES